MSGPPKGPRGPARSGESRPSEALRPQNGAPEPQHVPYITHVVPKFT